MRSLAATIVLFTLISPAQGQAPDEAIGLLVVPFSENDEGQQYASERARLDKVVRDTCRESGRYRPQAAPGELAFLKDFFECEVEGFPTCLANAGEQAKAEQVFWGELNQAQDQWELGLFILDVGSKRVVDQYAQSFPVGGGSLDDLIVVTRGFIEGKVEVPKPTGRVRIDSDPSGASVRVDGKSLEETPVVLDLEVGPHVIEVSVIDRGTKTRKIEIRPGENREPIFRFPEKPTEVAVRIAPPKKMDWRFWGGVTAMGVATVSGISSLVFLDQKQKSVDAANVIVNSATLNADGIKTITPAQGKEYDVLEKDFYSQRRWLFITAGIAAASAATGAYLLFVSDTATAAIVPTAGGVSVVGTF